MKLHSDLDYKGCAIATAVLGNESEKELESLRIYRSEVMESGWLGRVLSGYYNLVKVRVADFIKDRRILKASLLYVFVRPGIWLVRKRLRNAGALYGISAFLLVLLGTVWVTLLYVFASVYAEET